MMHSADLGTWRRIDTLCRQFERAWLEGSRPRLEDYLDRAPAADRDMLFEELLAIDHARRVEAGERPTIADYAARFPEHQSQIAKFLSEKNEHEAAADDAPGLLSRSEGTALRRSWAKAATARSTSVTTTF